MGEVSLKLNGRSYRLLCEDGNEDRLRELGDHLGGHIDRLTEEFGQIGDDRLLVMASVLVTDELWEAREQLAAQAADAAPPATAGNADASVADERPATSGQPGPGAAPPEQGEPAPDHESPATATRDKENSQTGT